MIMPHFDYVDFVLDSANKKCTDRLERLHKRAVWKVKYKTELEQKEVYDTLLRSYNLTTLYFRTAEHLLTFMFKKSKSDMEILNLPKPKIELRSKNKVKFKQIFTDKTKVQNSPLNRGIFLWNQLPSETQHLEDINIFKRHTRSALENGQIVYMKHK